MCTKQYLFSIICLILTQAVLAQSPSPAPNTSGAVLILGATAHIGDGKTVIANSAIAIENGKITFVGDATTMRIDRTKFSQIFDASGKHVYPGLIALNTTLGLVELDAVRATNDIRETGSMNPSVRSMIAYNTDSDLIPTVRTNGVLAAQIVPEGGLISGKLSLVQLDAWNWEDAALLTDQGLHIRWPRMVLQRPNADAADAPKENPYKTGIDQLEQFFSEAKAYCALKKHPQAQLKFEAMRSVFDKTTSLYIHAEKAQALRDAILFAQKFGCRVVLVEATEAYLIADLIAQNQVPVILGATQSLPPSDDHDYDQAYKTPSQLQAAGVLFAMTDNGSWRQRNLPFQAGQAVAFGLDKEAALAAITSGPAQILGVEGRMGTLAAGLDATLFINEGDVLDMRTNKVIAAFIQGRKIDLDNKQEQLYRKYDAKYKQ
jgi:imidazolonepropionase-like amidohydrolase